MALYTPPLANAVMRSGVAETAATQGRAASKTRDLRLDFFRGLAMFIIFTAHAPGNPWNDWIPARFGFSSGAELFVFCSGVASAGAFGMVFLKRGWWLGVARVAYRCWQVYWAHISLVVLALALGGMADKLFPDRHFAMTHLDPVMRDAPAALIGIVTLTWLPPFLDILPMYLVILGLIPVVMAARRLHRHVPLALMLGLYVAVWTFGLRLTGNPWTGDPWFFNPFAWQLIFFLGFAFKLGWLPVPPLRHPGWMAASIAFVLISIPLTFWGVLDHAPALKAVHDGVLGPMEKTDLHPLRVVHFLATAYLALSWLEPVRERLGGHLLMPIVKVGQQSLATFLASMGLAIVGGVVFTLLGHDAITGLLVNAGAILLIIAVAYTVGWFKSSPWREPAVKNTISRSQ